MRRAAAQLGHRPALTVLRAAPSAGDAAWATAVVRDEQGFASLAKWTAKGAHLLDLEAGLVAGDTIVVRGAAGWTTAIACFAAWWAGITVALEGSAALVVGDPLLDGASAPRYTLSTDPQPPAGAAEPWPRAAQLFPDQPPPPGAGPDVTAVRWPPVTSGDAAGTWTQQRLLDAAAALAPMGPVAVDRDAPPSVWLPALVRPLVTGAPTVILDGAPPEAATAERVATWLSGPGSPTGTDLPHP